MMRTRLLWFSLGFASTAAAMTQFTYKDLWLDRQSLSSQLKQNVDALDARVSNLEQVLPLNSASQKDDVNLN